MIKTRKELFFYIKADYMMNCGFFEPTLLWRLRDWFVPFYTMRFLVSMRKASYYSNKSSLLSILLAGYYKLKQRHYSYKTGWQIAGNSFGYGLLLPHYGTIVVGPNIIGNYAVLQTSTCISGNMKQIGNALYVATGGKLTANVTLGDNVTVAANAVVTKSFPDGNVLLGGIPAAVIKEAEPWYIRDGDEYYVKVQKIEELKRQIGINDNNDIIL